MIAAPCDRVLAITPLDLAREIAGRRGGLTCLGVVSVTTSIRALVGDEFAGRAPSPQAYSGEAHRALSGSDAPPSELASLTISAAVIHR